MSFFLVSKALPSLLMTSALMIGLLCVKTALRRHMAFGWQYNLWYLFIFLLAAPFLPLQWTDSKLTIDLFYKAINFTWPAQWMHPVSRASKSAAGGIYDFAFYAEGASENIPALFLFFLWLLGTLLFFSLLIHAAWKLRRMKRNFIIPEAELLALFGSCKICLGISGNAILRKSPDIHSPMIFGLFLPTVVLPSDLDKRVSEREMKYILLHELVHLKNGDLYMNYISCAFQAIYWFHPVVWFAFHKMREEREIRCDRSVLKQIAPESYTEYGLTMIHFIESISKNTFSHLAADIGGTKAQIKKRIIEIAAFSKEPFLLKCRGIAIFLLVSVLILAQAPVISVSARNRTASLQQEQVKLEDFSNYFDGYLGSFVLYDAKLDTYTVYNQEMSKIRISPDSTYKIYSALIALEEGAISPEQSSFRWNGMQYPYPEWNQDQDLSSAMQYSASWYFQALDAAVGLSALQDGFQKIQYGNCDLSGGIDRFWAESSLKISPVEQVKLLSQFYFRELPFSEQNIEAVEKTLLLSKQEDGNRLFGKTGTGIVEDQRSSGWFIGYVDTAEKPYFFAANIQGDGTGRIADGAKAYEIVIQILQEKNIY